MESRAPHPDLTTWRKGKPPMPGVWQTLLSNGMGLGFSHWDGKRWGWTCKTPNGAADLSHIQKTAAQDKQWRGLAANPNEVKS